MMALFTPKNYHSPNKKNSSRGSTSIVLNHVPWNTNVDTPGGSQVFRQVYQADLPYYLTEMYLINTFQSPTRYLRAVTS